MIRVTAAIMSNAGNVFIAKRKPTAKLANMWEFPGGKIEPGEAPEDCLRREILEEFDVDVLVGEKLGTNVHRYDFGTIELMAFRAAIISGTITVRDHAEVRWAPASELDELEFAPADVPFVEMIRRGEIEL